MLKFYNYSKKRPQNGQRCFIKEMFGIVSYAYFSEPLQRFLGHPDVIAYIPI